MNDSRPVKHVIQPKVTDLGEFSVKRLLPNGSHPMVGPWIFFDHMGPVTFAPGPGVAVRPHPHINLATVTYLFEGEILHRDSLGTEQVIQAGEINLMVAGRGIVHSEREREASIANSRAMHGLQLWLALPEEYEETEPEFLHYATAQIPTLSVEGVPVRVMIGRAYGAVSPVKTFAETLYVEAEIAARQVLAVPQGVEELAVYVVDGSVQLEGETLAQNTLSILNTQQALPLTATEDSRVVFIGGQNIGPRHVWWNFASSRKQRIEQAKHDWKEGRFAKVAGDEVEFIPLPKA